MRPVLSDFHPLFEDVQEQRIFPDGKTFVDCIAKHPVTTILDAYSREKDQKQFDLASFVREHFLVPVGFGSEYKANRNEPVEQHIEALWDVLTRQPDDTREAGSLIALPYPYIVPGGRFGEIYYWDSYFTLLGLKESGRTEMVENMVNNFSYLIDTIGYVPNGNRSYYIGRSQPPFYSLMIRLLAEMKGESILIKYLPQLEKEYAFWMNGSDLLNSRNPYSHSVMLMPGGEILNRYWDENDVPRPEAYREDVELARESNRPPAITYRHLRAGAASGWDFTSRWFSDPRSFASIHTTDIIPVDLNCLLFELEQLLAHVYTLNGHTSLPAKYNKLADQRKHAIQRYCWNDAAGFFFDNDAIEGAQTDSLSLAGTFPLFSGIATQEQANAVASVIRKKFLKEGGLVTTLEITGQQWDAPNGWAPLQWIAIEGLKKYGHEELAEEITARWIRLNTDVYHRTGKLMEKYNVVDTHLEAGGGEYAGQDGFGWTNGVLLALIGRSGNVRSM